MKEIIKDNVKYGFTLFTNHEYALSLVKPHNILLNDDRQYIANIPESFDGLPVTVVHMGAVKNDQFIKEIMLPKSIREIEPCFCSNCPNLKKIIINNPNCKISPSFIKNLRWENLSILCPSKSNISSMLKTLRDDGVIDPQIHIYNQSQLKLALKGDEER